MQNIPWQAPRGYTQGVRGGDPRTASVGKAARAVGGAREILAAFDQVRVREAGRNPGRIAGAVVRERDESRQRSMTMSLWGWEQQISTLPSAGASIGSGR